MEIRVAVDVRASTDELWDVVSDVTRWPERLPTVDALEVLGDGPVGPGAQVRIVQPRLRPLVWTVTRWEPGWQFTWEATAAGVRAVAGHAVEPAGAGSRLTLTLTQSGLLAPVVGLLLGRRTKEYVHTEARSLQAAAEAA